MCRDCSRKVHSGGRPKGACRLNRRSFDCGRMSRRYSRRVPLLSSSAFGADCPCGVPLKSGGRTFPGRRKKRVDCRHAPAAPIEVLRGCLCSRAVRLPMSVPRSRHRSKAVAHGELGADCGSWCQSQPLGRGRSSGRMVSVDSDTEKPPTGRADDHGDLVADARHAPIRRSEEMRRRRGSAFSHGGLLRDFLRRRGALLEGAGDHTYFAQQGSDHPIPLAGIPYHAL